MKIIYSLLFSILLLSMQPAKAQVPALRGIYVNGFDDILGNSAEEDRLLQYAQDSSFNYLALYDLQAINLSSSTNANKLASFMNRARTNYGVQYIGAVCESYSSFQNKIAPYNNGRSNANEKFNVFNLEFEFWITSSVQPGAYYCVQYLAPNNCACDTAGAFGYYKDQLRKIDSLASTQNALSETYVGWFNQGQGQQIASVTDRILVHAYRTDPSSVFGYSKNRLSYLASLNQQVSVVPIFSSEPDFMGPWLNSHSHSEAFNKYQSDFNADNSSWKPYIQLLGYHWFTYSYMPKPAPGSTSTFNPTITASGPLSLCSGASVTLTASSGSSYQWSTGATTASITVSTGGNYSCLVTKNTETKSTNVITVSVNASPAASFAIGNSSTGYVELNSTSSAGSGSISSYQWNFNGYAIAGASSPDYTASSSGNYTLRVTNSNGCSHTSTSQSISVPVSSCQLSVPAGLTSFNLSPTSVMLSWSSLPSCDTVIVRYKKESSSIYTYVKIPYTGDNTLTLTNITPNVKYSWRVKTQCGTQQSGYSSKKYFTTYGTSVNLAYAPSDRLEQMITEEKVPDQELNIYPNPVKDLMKITFYSGEDIHGEIKVMDLTGRAVKSMAVSLTEGENSIALPVTELPSGLYIVSLDSPELKKSRRVLIQ